MDYEVDLSPYLFAIWKQKWLILLFAAIGAFVGSRLLSRVPERFEAVALVAVVESRDIIQFDPRFLDVGEKQPLQAFPELALSDEALNKIIEDEAPCSLEDLTVVDIRQMASATLGDDSTLIRLRIVHENPESAVCLVNQWAENFVFWANSLFGDQNEEQILFYESQLNAAEASLNELNDGLISFQAINSSQIISNTLSFYQNTRVDLLEDQRRVEGLIRSSESLKGQLMLQDIDSLVSYADQLTFFQLQQQVLNGEANSAILLQTSNAETLTTGNVDDQIQLIDNLLKLLDAQAEQIQTELNGMEPTILSLQQEQSAQLVALASLERELSIAVDTAVTLAYKLEEERLRANDASSVFRLASLATGEPKQLFQSWFVYLFVGFAVGLFVSSSGVVLKTVVSQFTETFPNS